MLSDDFLTKISKRKFEVSYYYLFFMLHYTLGRYCLNEILVIDNIIYNDIIIYYILI